MASHIAGDGFSGLKDGSGDLGPRSRFFHWRASFAAARSVISERSFNDAAARLLRAVPRQRRSACWRKPANALPRR